jgi:hypothetical protein
MAHPVNPGGVPNVNAPLVDPGGRLSQPWYQFFVGLGTRGGTIDFDVAPPVRGTWARGSVRFNVAAAIGQPKGWVCTVAGTPGTWVSTGNL